MRRTWLPKRKKMIKIYVVSIDSTDIPVSSSSAVPLMTDQRPCLNDKRRWFYKDLRRAVHWENARKFDNFKRWKHSFCSLHVELAYVHQVIHQACFYCIMGMLYSLKPTVWWNYQPNGTVHIRPEDRRHCKWLLEWTENWSSLQYTYILDGNKVTKLLNAKDKCVLVAKSRMPVPFKNAEGRRFFKLTANIKILGGNW